MRTPEELHAAIAVLESVADFGEKTDKPEGVTVSLRMAAEVLSWAAGEDNAFGVTLTRSLALREEFKL